MGKIRIKTIGDETTEKKQKAQAKKRQETKKLEERQAAREPEADSVIANTSNRHPRENEDQILSPFGLAQGKQAENDKKQIKKDKFAKSSQKRSSRYLEVKSLVEKDKIYSLKDALLLLPKLKLAKFDETVELHINTTEAGVSGNLVLPHGTGKKLRVVIANPSQDPVALDALVKKITAGTIDFDVLIATPDAMPKLARVAKFLGPKGLMPNPKSGTVSPKPEEVAKKFEAGQVNFKTEAKAPIIHIAVGKVSFGEEKLADNIKAIIKSLQANKVKNATLKSTMSPGIKINTASL